MPNYVRNILKMEGIAELPLFNVAQGEKYFDFNLLIPIYVLRIAMMRNASIITGSRFGMGFELVYGRQHQINLKLKGI